MTTFDEMKARTEQQWEKYHGEIGVDIYNHLNPRSESKGSSSIVSLMARPCQNPWRIKESIQRTHKLQSPILQQHLQRYWTWWMDFFWTNYFVHYFEKSLHTRKLSNDSIKYQSWHQQSNHHWYPGHWQVALSHLSFMEIGQGREACSLHLSSVQRLLWWERWCLYVGQNTVVYRFFILEWYALVLVWC